MVYFCKQIQMGSGEKKYGRVRIDEDQEPIMDIVFYSHCHAASGGDHFRGCFFRSTTA